ncbi:DUF488 domain-containing protein [Candidatus Bathyarchaeota archaeon]|nr:MAG: DUF488 domain-containing protein [Candidatus Bathyarchaeota archaeon]
MHLYTVGHSNRTLHELVSLLKEHQIQAVADVRSWPTSKRNPHFNRQPLREALENEGITYIWLGKELGGYRHKGLGSESPNKGWSSPGFRNYADHTLTLEFKEGIQKLLSVAEHKRTAYMCAEKFYWRCHRRIISDYLTAQGHKVTHIVDKGETREHRMTRFAQVKNGKLSYPETLLKPT